jgi:hypothetical protein
MKEFEIYDEASGKTLNIKANSLEEAETISEDIDFDDYEDGDFVMAKGGEVDENRVAIQKHRNKLVSLNSKSLTPSEHDALTKAINIMDMLLDGELILSPEIEKMYKNEGGDIDEGQTDEELYSALTEMGYDYGEYGSDDFDDSGFSEMAINLGYRWDEENKLWFNKNMAKGGRVKKKWIQDALGGDEGSLRRTAKRKGLLRGDENLSMTDLKKLQRMGGKTAKRAHLAETLRKFDEGGMFSQDDLHKLVADMDEDEYDNFCAEYDLDCDDANEVENFIYDAKMYDAQKMIREIKSGKYK